MNTPRWLSGIARTPAILAATLAATLCLPASAFTVTIAPVPAGGYVTGSPGGLDCGPGRLPCTSSNITALTNVTLTAHPDAGCSFSQWSVPGIGTSTANPLVFPMPNQDVSGIAAFRCAPHITSAASATFQTGVAGSFTVTATGVPSPTFTVTGGSLPGGVTLATNGTLAGTPNANTGGQYPFSITASNGVSPSATQGFTLTVNQPPAFVHGGSTFTFPVNAIVAFSSPASGYPAPTVTLATGALPTGFSLAADGTFSGTAATGTAGTYAVTIKAANGIAPDATAAHTLNVQQAPGAIPTPSRGFEGLGWGFVGPGGSFPSAYAPSGANIAVGPDHVVQVVNVGMAVFGKTGTTIGGPYTMRNFWGSNPSPCSARNDGIPLVQYDRAADRWVLVHTVIQLPATFYLCVAVSQTANPIGAYHLYPIPLAQGVDAAALAVWPDAYYLTYDAWNADYFTFEGARACALDRARMLQGLSATPQCFSTSTAYRGLLPADLDGVTPPPAGSPNYVMALGSDPNTLLIWKFHVDWTTPANTTFTGPAILATDPFTLPCVSTPANCIPQPGTTNKLDALSGILAFRLTYRNFGGHETLLASHVAAAGPSAGMRWYEIRSPGGTPAIVQQGTHAPDSHYRWAGSAAMDWQGNIAMGYAVASQTAKPQIRYAGRHAADPPGQLSQGEATLFAGGGVQTSLNRWGDITSLRIDPSDDCTFWYTGQYMPQDGAFNWRTRIGAFRLAACIPPTTVTVTSSPNPSVYGQAYTLTATVAGHSPTGTVTFRMGSSLIATKTLVSGSASQPIVSYAVGTFPFSASYSGDAANGGSESPTHSHAVTKANAVVTITSHSPDPSPVLTAFTVGATVSLAAPASGPVTGTVVVSDGTASCTITLPATSCALVPLTSGTKTLTAAYAGDGHVNAAVSAGVAHTVSAAAAIPRLANIATRMQVLTGADVLIGGFIIGGTQPKAVVVRARGPSLTAAGVPGALQNPLLQVFSGPAQVAVNDDWQQDTNAAALLSSGFAPSDPRESAILASFTPGAYTAIVSGAGATTGVGIVEVFEVDKPEVPLVNIATRGQVLTGADVMIGGFIIQGDGPQTVIVRARGPSLTAAGVHGALQDPVLQLFSGQAVIATNDDWQASADAAAIQSSGFAPSDAREAVIRIALNPGAYTAIVTGKNGTTGVGIIEVFAQ